MTEIQKCIYVVDDDDSIRWVLEKALTGDGFAVQCFASAEMVLQALNKKVPDALLTDIRMPGMDGLSLLEKLSKQYPDLAVVVMTAQSDLDSAVASFEKGAFDYLPKPFDIDEICQLMQRAVQKSSVNTESEKSVASSQELLGESPAMQEVFRIVGRLSRSNATVLIHGASGTGKELIAKALHKHGPNGKNNFVAINVAAIPKQLIESELFGHEKGAFTGANQQHIGRFEQADQGTLFLDEIGDMPMETQTRLLRVLAEGEFYRVGGRSMVKTNTRVIAATHQNLLKLAQQGKFREDLYHRLNVIRIDVPSLKDRIEDITLLAKHFLHQAAKQLQVAEKTLHQEVIDYFKRLPWPGNVRQLENICHWLTVMASGKEIHLSDLPAELKQQAQQKELHSSSDWRQSLIYEIQTKSEKNNIDLSTYMKDLEKLLIEQALQQTQSHKQKAAKLLGWGRNTLTRKIKEYQLYT